MRKWILAPAALLIMLGGAYFAADHLVNAAARERAGEFARDARSYVRDFRYGSVRVSLIERSFVLRDVAIVLPDGERLTAAGLTVSDFDWTRRGPPRFARIHVNGAELPSAVLAAVARLPAAGSSADAQRLLDRAGYRRTTGDLAISYRYDEHSGELELRDNRLEIADLGVLTLSLKLGNVPSFDAGAAAMWSGLTRVTLVNGSLAFQDRSLVSRLVQAYAAEHGLSAAGAHAELVREVRKMRGREPDRLRREALGALLAFAERPGELALRIDPPRPLALLDFFLGPGDLKERLGARIAAR